MGVKLIRLERVPSSSRGIAETRRSYVFQANLSPDGQLQIDGYGAVSRLCKVIKSGPGLGRREGFLVLTSDGWVLSCDGGADCCRSADRLEAKTLSRGAYVTIRESNGAPDLFQVVSVEDARVEAVSF